MSRPAPHRVSFSVLATSHDEHAMPFDELNLDTFLLELEIKNNRTFTRESDACC